VISGRSGRISSCWFWLTSSTAEKVSRLPSTKVVVEPSSNTLGRRVLAASPQASTASDAPL
jgi:hypothetical protein